MTAAKRPFPVTISRKSDCSTEGAAIFQEALRSSHTDGAAMEIEWPVVVEGGIPILGGLYATALGNGVIRLGTLPPNVNQLLQRLKWLGPLVVLFGVYTAWQTHRQLVHPPAAELARQMASRLIFPHRVDAMTTLDGIQGSNDAIVYHYSVTTPLPDLGGLSVVQGKLQEKWRELACTNPDLQKMLGAGYSLQMEYTFPAASQIVIAVPAASCSS